MFSLQGEWEEKYFQATDMNIKEVFHKYCVKYILFKRRSPVLNKILCPFVCVCGKISLLAAAQCLVHKGHCGVFMLTLEFFYLKNIEFI